MPNEPSSSSSTSSTPPTFSNSSSSSSSSGGQPDVSGTQKARTNASNEPSFLSGICYRVKWLACCLPSEKVGDKSEYSALISLFVLGAVTTATFAVTVIQVTNSVVLASIFYGVFVFLVVILVAVIVNSQEADRPKYDRATTVFGRWIAISIFTLSAIFVLLAQLRWFPGQMPKRQDFTSVDIPCDKPVLVEQHAQANASGVYFPGTLEERDGIEQFKSWFGSIWNVDPTKTDEKQILTIEQSPAFENDYNTFSAELFLTPDVIFDGALVFIRRAHTNHVGGHVTYDLEQIRLPVSNTTTRQLPVIQIDNPNTNDSLLIFIHVSAAKGVKLSTDPEWYHFHLRRVPR
jgi:hypothetical protein